MAKYRAESDGRILCDGEVIGLFRASTGQLRLPDGLPEVAITHIKAQLFDILVGTKSVPNGRFEPTPVPLPVLPEPESKPELPPPPEMDPRLGDKTPAFMEWMKTHQPEEFARRYKGRRSHWSTGINPHLGPPGDVPEAHIPKEKEEEWK